jgi:hypothetical protein
VVLVAELHRLLDELVGAVTKSERCSVSTSQPTPSSAKTKAMMLPFDHALALFGNTCDMRFQQPWG